MARSNQPTDFTKVVTPINNTRFFKSQLYAKPNAENLNCDCYYRKPEVDNFPDDKSYQIALDIFNANEKEYEDAVKNGLQTKVFDENTKKYEVDLTIKSEKNENSSYQAIAGRLLNFYTISDTFNDGKVKQKFIADVMDFKANERYQIELSIAVVGRKFIDKICSLTATDLQHDIQFSLNKYVNQHTKKPTAAAKVFVLDSNAEHGRREIEGIYELSVFDQASQKTISLCKGSEANNEEFLKALEMKIENAVDKPLVKFYKRITMEFQENVLKPCVTEMFKEMGWNMEIKDEMKDKKMIDGKVINEKTREVIYLTPINGLSETSKATAEKPSDELAEDLPF